MSEKPRTVNQILASLHRTKSEKAAEDSGFFSLDCYTLMGHYIEDVENLLERLSEAEEDRDNLSAELERLKATTHRAPRTTAHGPYLFGSAHDSNAEGKAAHGPYLFGSAHDSSAHPDLDAPTLFGS